MSRARDSEARFQWRWIAIGGSLIMAILLWIWQSPDLSAFRHWAEEASHHPLTMLAVMLIMAVTLAVGLPGSIGLWLIAPFHPPWIATLMLLIGSLGGALGAYWLAARFRQRMTPKGLTKRIMTLMSERSDAFTQCAFRILPGFPHSVINYAAGLLRLPLGTFVVAALLGLGVKWAVYASAIHGALEAVESGDAFSIDVLLPLIALTLLLLMGAWVRRRVERRRSE
ncbi:MULTISPECIES: TVP38/TMEM64 family protein [Halomonadaceae]|uniref:TVP38/TMEM64 family protein n=1 Tax=Halomonadaceae TaxID=28256 RepID=UPI00200C2D49|nr:MULTISPECIES: VTT domain-containing protein [Halomonas]